MSNALADANTSHEEFKLMRNESESYQELKENISIKNSERDDSKRDRLIIKQNGRINDNIKSQV